VTASDVARPSFLGAFLLGGALLAACGAEPPRARVQADDAPRPVLDGGADARATDAALDPLPAAARIAESGAAFAPGMRELVRVDEEAPFERPLVHAADKDTCVRVAFAASEPLSVALLDGAGATLDATPRAASGVTSTVCVKRAGDVVLKVARAGAGDAGNAGAAARVRAVAFAAP
jgi:hypothetical protein